MKNVLLTIFALMLMAPAVILGLYPSYLIITGAMTPEAYLTAFAKAWHEDFWSGLVVAITCTLFMFVYAWTEAKRLNSAQDASANQRT